MLKLEALISQKVWGYENWIASVHPVSFHKDFINECGKDYPLLVKVIQANDSLSVQVHPDDFNAIKLEGEGNRGKTECWYVLDAAEDSTLVYGLKAECKKTSKEELSIAIQNNELEKYLNIVHVKKGDFIFIPAGTIHAIGGGLRLLEIQQSCDLTYRLYDWGRQREVQIEKGLQVINESALRKIDQFSGDFECEYFSLDKIDVKGGYSCLVSKGEGLSKDWKLFYIINGNGSVKNSEGQKFELKSEEIIAVKPGEKVTFEGLLEILKISAK